MDLHPCVYILASQFNGTLYVGSTTNLSQRLWIHQNSLLQGFTSTYQVHRLVWYESHETLETAIQRERNLKKWDRAWKIRLIMKMNPEWKDLSTEIL